MSSRSRIAYLVLTAALVAAIVTVYRYNHERQLEDQKIARLQEEARKQAAARAEADEYQARKAALFGHAATLIERVNTTIYRFERQQRGGANRVVQAHQPPPFFPEKWSSGEGIAAKLKSPYPSVDQIAQFEKAIGKAAKIKERRSPRFQCYCWYARRNPDFDLSADLEACFDLKDRRLTSLTLVDSEYKGDNWSMQEIYRDLQSWYISTHTYN